jgi:hypothetical protein
VAVGSTVGVAIAVLLGAGVEVGAVVGVEVAGSEVGVSGARVAVLVGTMAMVSGVSVGAGTAVLHPTNNTTTNQMILFISPPSLASNVCSEQLYFPQKLAVRIIAFCLKVGSSKNASPYR